MNEELAAFLSQYEPLAEEWPVWGNGRIPLHECTYLSPTLPPDTFITSARAVLFRGDEVMVIQNSNGLHYITPGGRREPGESVDSALRREVLEETGWALAQTAVLGFMHFHHLGPKPDGYPYPYPDFVQIVFMAIADSYQPEAIKFDYYIAGARFMPITAATALNLDMGQKVLLAAAIKQYKGM